MWQILEEIYYFIANQYEGLITGVIVSFVICDCLSENPPSSHLPVFREIATILALVVESFTEHNEYYKNHAGIEAS